MSHLQKRKDAPDVLGLPIVSFNPTAIKEWIEKGTTAFPYAMVSCQQARVVHQAYSVHGQPGDERTWISVAELWELVNGRLSTPPAILAELKRLDAENAALKERISRAQAALDGMVAIAL